LLSTLPEIADVVGPEEEGRGCPKVSSKGVSMLVSGYDCTKFTLLLKFLRG